MSFKRAERRNAKLRLALSGVSGSGKTYSALLMAREFGSKIAVLDSERGSASLYADLVSFDVCELEDHTIQEYMAKICDAAAAGYDVLVIDSYSHSWMSALEAIDRSGGWTRGGKTISPLVQKLVNTVLTYPGHVIATLRSKTDYAIEKDDNGKTTMKKLGLGPVARPDTEYEFTVMLDLTREGAITVSKARGALPPGAVYTRDTDVPKIAKALKAWLESGAPVSPRDTMAEKIRFVPNEEALKALIPELTELFKADPDARGVLMPIYQARKAEFAEAPVE